MALNADGKLDAGVVAAWSNVESLAEGKDVVEVSSEASGKGRKPKAGWGVPIRLSPPSVVAGLDIEFKFEVGLKVVANLSAMGNGTTDSLSFSAEFGSGDALASTRISTLEDFVVSLKNLVLDFLSPDEDWYPTSVSYPMWFEEFFVLDFLMVPLDLGTEPPSDS